MKLLVESDDGIILEVLDDLEEYDLDHKVDRDSIGKYIRDVVAELTEDQDGADEGD